MSIEKMMCLSTGHVTQQTAEAIDLALHEETLDYNDRDVGLPDWWNGLPVYRHGEYGWLICIAGDTVDHIDLIESGIPEELYGCMKHAHAHGCEWLLLDRDADLIDELPSFDW